MTNQTYIRAGHADTSADELWVLSRHAEMRIRRRVAENERTPVHVLLALAADPDPEVRLASALHPATPETVTFHLVRDECVDVRYALAEDCQVPAGVLLMLARDENPYVADRAMRTLSRRGGHPTAALERDHTAHHRILVFTGGTALGRATLMVLESVISDQTACEIVECDIHERKHLKLAKKYGVCALPTIVVDGAVSYVGCPAVEDLIELGIPLLVAS